MGENLRSHIQTEAKYGVKERDGLPKVGAVKVEKPSRGAISINLIGRSSEDALEALEGFLSDAILSGFGELQFTALWRYLKETVAQYLKITL